MSGRNEVLGHGDSGHGDAEHGADPNAEANRHALLCAHVLGELEGEERERLERELETSPDLRAERARIEATIGLVRGAFAGKESLSADLLGELEGLAAPAPIARPRFGASWMRAAAGFALFACGLVAVQEATKERSPVGTRELVARGESPVLDRGADKEEGARSARKQDAPPPASAGARADETLHRRKLVAEAGSERADSPELRQEPFDAFEGRALDAGELATLGTDLGTKGAEARRVIDGVTILKGRNAKSSDEGYRGPGDSVPPSATPPSPQVGFDVTAPAAGAELLHFEPAPGSGGVAKDALTQQVQPWPLNAQGDSSGSNAWSVSGGPAAGGDGASSVLLAEEQKAGIDRNLRFGVGAETGSAAETSSFGKKATPNPERQRAAGAAELRATASTPAPAGPSSPGPSGPIASNPSAPTGTVSASTREARLGETTKSGEDDFYLGGGRAYDDDDRAKRPLTPAERDALVTRRVELVLTDCRRRPGERPSAMYFRFWGDNPFVLAQLDPLSTFGVDVDTASYALARRYLADGYLPEKAQVRTEEFVNYFAPDVAAPTEDVFGVHADLAPSRFGATANDFGAKGERWMLRVVVRGKEVSREERPPLALTFVVDVSGSMQQENRLELVKHSLRLLSNELDARDSIAIVAFSNEARLVLPATSAAQRGVIEAALYGLTPGGGTNAESGLKLGYEVALASLSTNAQSRVVFLSDGVANIGQTDQDRLSDEVKRQRQAGIFLNTVGVGMGNHNDALLEQLADKGDGLCNYVDGPQEARRALVDNFTGAFVPIARDVKIQVEFDPARVYRWRQLGYENRAIADQDFRNDAVDAGEVGSGHQVTALYELELVAPPKADDAALATVRLRWKPPTGAGRDPLEDAATERAFPIAGSCASAWEASSVGYRRSVLVAQFAEILRRSTHARDDSLDELLAEATKLDRELGDADFHEFVAMVEKSRRLVLELRPPHDPLARCIDSLRRNCILRAELDDVRFDRDPRVIDEIELQNRELEARIRDLIRQQVEDEAH